MTVRFVEEKVLPEDGQVNHALRGALSRLLRDYLVCIIFHNLFIIHCTSVCRFFIIIVLVICSSTRNRAHSRKVEFTKTMVLHPTNHDNNVHIKSNYFHNL